MNKIATYRLQLQPEFGFNDVRQIVPYLKNLGISHVYTSPYLQAASGSTHGYDVVNHSHTNHELGGDDAHQLMCESITDAGLAQLLDIVPNHMAIAGEQNPWWWDVLENGAASLYATYFDVDWENSEERWQNKILLPVLADHYGRILEAGEIKLQHKNTQFYLCYFDQRFPIDPSSLSVVLAPAAQSAASDILGFLAESYDRIPKPHAEQSAEISLKRHRDKAVLHTLLSDACKNAPDLITAIDQQIARINANVDLLDKLIEQQNYRLAYWKSASRDLGYRRFFDISNLAGLRIEDDRVFQETHALIFRWVESGWVQGLRVDHSDGLRDPKGYFQKLRNHCPDAWLVTEKILERDEHYRTDWPIEGTTGYEFLALCTRLLTNPSGEAPLKTIYQEFTRQTADLDTISLTAKDQIISELLQSEFNRLTALCVNICEQQRRQRDFSRSELYHALCCVAKNFSVYRTYITPDEDTHPDDLAQINHAVKKAKQDHPEIDPELLDFLGEILRLEHTSELGLELAMRFQQLTGPVMAKSIEDTTFYRYNVLVAHNDVGNSPKYFSSSLAEFHHFMSVIQKERPYTLLTLTTHDTKRSEDTRARLLTLSEVPDSWSEFLIQWQNQATAPRDAKMPPEAVYFILQTLVATWPITQERLMQYFTKAFREAKVATSWTAPNQTFENSIQAYVTDIYHSEPRQTLLTQFIATINHAGFYNALTQTLLKLTAPGVPDIYQGCELWDFSLVDPDNRRPIDYHRRQQYLSEVKSLSTDQIMAGLEQGLPKLWLTVKALEVRRQYPACFDESAEYLPILATGTFADHVIAYQRAQDVICVCVRFHLSKNMNLQSTQLPLPQGHWLNVLTGDVWHGAEVSASQLLERFPVAILVRNNK